VIVGDVVDLECAGVDVAQDKVGRGFADDGSNARELLIQADLAQGLRAGDLVVADVVNPKFTGIGVAQQKIAFLGDAAEVADARELPLRADRAQEGGVVDLVVDDVVDLQITGIGVAHEQIAGAAAAEVADAREQHVAGIV
jgi:hypothetical protein